MKWNNNNNKPKKKRRNIITYLFFRSSFCPSQKFLWIFISFHFWYTHKLVSYWMKHVHQKAATAEEFIDRARLYDIFEIFSNIFFFCYFLSSSIFFYCRKKGTHIHTHTHIQMGGNTEIDKRFVEKNMIVKILSKRRSGKK